MNLKRLSPFALAAITSLAACGQSPRFQWGPTASGTFGNLIVNRGHITLSQQIQFATNSAEIQEGQSEAVLRDLAALLRDNPQIRAIRVEGHTDLRGDAAANLELSQNRARSVAQYLERHGASSVRFEPTGYGITQPLCREDADSCHDRNRRVEFTVTDPAPGQ
ncbi:MAG: OmpA family protein [Myxococcales bacterium]|nr:OmpA family protein [Myxococcales bacterium]